MRRSVIWRPKLSKRLMYAGHNKKTRFVARKREARRKYVYFRRSSSFPSTGGLGVSTQTLDGKSHAAWPRRQGMSPRRPTGSEFLLASLRGFRFRRNFRAALWDERRVWTVKAEIPLGTALLPDCDRVLRQHANLCFGSRSDWLPSGTATGAPGPRCVVRRPRSGTRE